MIEPAAAFIAFVNRVPKKGSFTLHAPPPNTFPRELLPLAAARAIELLDEWKEVINDNFYEAAPHWFDDTWPTLPADWKPAIRQIIAAAWSRRHTIYEDPVKRAERLEQLPNKPRLTAPSFAKIRADLVAMLPKHFETPRES